MVLGHIAPGRRRRGRRAAGAPRITVFSQNVRSLKIKPCTLGACAGELRLYDAVAVTESWLTGAVADSELQLGFPDHCWFRRDRDGIGGGVTVAVRSSLAPMRRTDLETDCELLAVQIGDPSSGLLYRPPDVNADIGKIMAFVEGVRTNN